MSKLSSPGQAVRLDTEHTVQELMTRAISQINRALHVELREQQVRLTGAAESWHEKQMAQESLRSMSSSYVIHNEIQVAAWT